MSENNLKTNVKELEAKVRLQKKEINDYLDKIENLEDMIMELEDSYFKQTDKADPSVSKIQLKDLEIENRDLKNKLSMSKLENVKLKQKLEKVKKGQLINSSLIQVVNHSPVSNLEPSITGEVKIKEDQISQKEPFKYIKIRCFHLSRISPFLQ